MKIARKDNHEVDFSTLNLGDVFKADGGDVFKDDGDIFMVIEEVESKKGGIYSAVNMETGKLAIFYTGEKVVPLQAELIVN